MRRFIAAALASAVLFAAAQAADPPKADPPTPPLKGVLPRDFKKLGLTGAQHQKVLTITADYRARIAALEQQLADLKAAEHKEVYGVLTDDQKKHLAELLTGDTQPTPPKDK